VLRHVTGADGVRIACQISGDGQPLVLVHGAGSARWSFDLVRQQLESRFTVAAIDRRGRGDSEDGSEYALSLEFEDVAAVVGELGEETLLLGHSYGALVAAGAAAMLPRPRRLVLYEPPAGGVLGGPAYADRLEALVASGERELMVEGFLRDVGGYSPAEIDAMRATPAWEGRLAAAPTVSREVRAESGFELGRSAVVGLAWPTLLLVGSDSPEWARRSTELFARAIPGARVRTLPGQGHGAATSAPDLLAAEVAGFLSEPEPARSAARSARRTESGR
jgi:pimeloyl-ACP methyl ester carboxylesterase